MDALTLIVIVILIGLTLLLILYPLWQQTHAAANLQSDRTVQSIEEYEIRYQAVLASIKELMFDYEMGRVSDEDYANLLAKAKLEAAGIRKQIDRLQDASAADKASTTLDGEIEALVSQVRQSHEIESAGLLREIDAEIELLKDGLPDSELAAEPTCSSCGQPFQPEDKFCSKCGQPVIADEVELEPQVTNCPQCGYVYEAGDAFCARCGTALAQDEKSPSYEDAKI